jgi:dihydrofolate synthase/folylpolyglutamate synthase
MDYSDLIEWMFKLERFGIKLGLENMTEFLSKTGNPHKDFRSVHVTGTNGKGSVCAFLSSILVESGLKVGLYTSPHLVDFRERITVNGQMIPEEDVVRLGNYLRAAMEEMAGESDEKQLTFFEFTTGLAFKYFSEQQVDIAVIEVGMGGRLDATNVIVPELSVITRIGLEHTAYLGGTLTDIAREKAGIVKTGVPVVCSERDPAPLAVIRSTCERKAARLMLIGRDFSAVNTYTDLDGTSFGYRDSEAIEGLNTRLIGAHQAENATIAIAVARQLADTGYPVSEESIREGISKSRWPGRLDIRSRNPLVIVDGSHNPAGVRTSVSVLASLGLTPLTFVVACMSDKDARGIILALAPYASKLIVTQADTCRSTKADQLSWVAEQLFTGDLGTEQTVSGAMLNALSNTAGNGVCAIGSFYLVGEVLKWLEATESNAAGKEPTRKV